MGPGLNEKICSFYRLFPAYEAEIHSVSHYWHVQGHAKSLWEPNEGEKRHSTQLLQCNLACYTVRPEPGPHICFLGFLKFYRKSGSFCVKNVKVNILKNFQMQADCSKTKILSRKILSKECSTGEKVMEGNMHWGHHLYKEIIRHPAIGKVLQCEREPRNVADQYCVVVRKGVVAGHLSLDICHVR